MMGTATVVEEMIASAFLSWGEAFSSISTLIDCHMFSELRRKGPQERDGGTLRMLRGKKEIDNSRIIN